MAFSEEVYRIVRQIPAGKVATYGQIAAMLGAPGAARAVGNALHRNPDGEKTPCFKVVNARGEVAREFGFGGAEEQIMRLRMDGVEVRDGKVDLDKYQWK